MYYLILPIINLPAPPSQNYPITPLKDIVRMFEQGLAKVLANWSALSPDRIYKVSIISSIIYLLNRTGKEYMTPCR